MTSHPPIPDGGLAEVLSTWAGRGSLWDALATPADAGRDRPWTGADLRLRAHRVLFERLLPSLAQWPSRLSMWVDLLPASRMHARVTRDTPFSGVSWSASKIRYGWPPVAFIGHETERGADMLLATTLRWTLDRLLHVRRDAVRAFPDMAGLATPQLDAAAALLGVEPVASASGIEPRGPELLALRREGSPWGAVADVAEELGEAERSLSSLAARLLMPDDEIRWRLFHLAILGVLLRALRELGCAVTSRRPLSAGIGGPAYTVLDPAGRHWDLWFEASTIWSYHGEAPPYVEATQGFSKLSRALGADLLLIRPKKAALILECKYSPDPGFVARNGYYQAMTYASEVRSRLAEEVTSVAIGPEGVVRFPSFTETLIGKIGTSPPSGIGTGVRDAIGGESQTGTCLAP